MKMSRINDERMAVIETEVKNINKSIDNHIIEQRKDFNEIFNKIDTFIDKFATKKELKAVEMKIHNLKVDVNWNKNKILSITKDIAVIGSIIALLLKQYNIL